MIQQRLDALTEKAWALNKRLDAFYVRDETVISSAVAALSVSGAEKRRDAEATPPIKGWG